MMFAGLTLLYWDKNRIAELNAEYDLPKKRYAPKVSRLWVNAGDIYKHSFNFVFFGAKDRYTI
jgi:hypothetical protein